MWWAYFRRQTLSIRSLVVTGRSLYLHMYMCGMGHHWLYVFHILYYPMYIHCGPDWPDFLSAEVKYDSTTYFIDKASIAFLNWVESKVSMCYHGWRNLERISTVSSSILCFTWTRGPPQYKDSFSWHGVSILKIRKSRGRLIFYNGNSYSAKMKSFYWNVRTFQATTTLQMEFENKYISWEIEWFDKAMCIKSP